MTLWRGTCGLVAAVLIAIPLVAAQAANPDDWWVDIANDRAARVATMLGQGADPNEISPVGQPAIMQAIRDGAWNVYDVLLKHPQTVFNAINVNRETPLMYLAVIGETERAADLIKRGALVNRKGWTPLHYAASTGQLDTAKMLLEHGAQVNAPAPDDTTPLMMAAYGGSEAMVRLLLEAGADVHRRNRQDYDVVDWAGFKSNTALAAKLKSLMEGSQESSRPASQGSATAESSATPVAPTRDKAGDPDGVAQPESGTSSTSRYFDLDRFNDPATP